MMQNPMFKNFSLQNQEISPKLTLKNVTRASEFGQEETLVHNAINHKMKFDIW
jgi:hypothetical protein